MRDDLPQGLHIFTDLPSLEPYEMMTGKGWFDERNFYYDEEDGRWKVRLQKDM